jgi:hypothetical protein
MVVLKHWYRPSLPLNSGMGLQRAPAQKQTQGGLRLSSLVLSTCCLLRMRMAAMEAAGKPIGAYDLLIAGQALRQKLTLVTANAREFGRIKGLLWEDWAKS